MTGSLPHGRPENDEKWQRVSLPHCYAVVGFCSPRLSVDGQASRGSELRMPGEAAVTFRVTGSLGSPLLSFARNRLGEENINCSLRPFALLLDRGHSHRQVVTYFK